MGKMKQRKYMTLLLSAVASMTLSAQQLNESLSVEGEFSPEINHIERINTLPRQVCPEMPSSSLRYAAEGVTTDTEPVIVPLPATGWRNTRTLSAYKGYFDFGMGSYLNTVASAGYRFVDNSSTKAGAWLQHNSSWTFKPELSEAVADLKRKRADTSIGLYASHIFDDAGRLDADIAYHLGYFNYYGIIPDAYNNNLSAAPTQTLNDFSLNLSWRGKENENGLNYFAAVDYRYFGYRRFYTHENIYEEIGKYTSEITDYKGQKENHLRLAGGLSLPYKDGSSIGLDLDLDLLFYSGDKNIPQNVATPVDDYANLKLTPFYRFSRNAIDVRIGADIDLSFNAGPEGNRYSVFHIAPDIRIGWSERKIGLYLHLLGGTELRTLASEAHLDYYQAPLMESTRPLYSPLDGKIGFNFGPFSGFSGGFAFAYKMTNNRPIYYRYMYDLNAHTYRNQGADYDIRGWNIGVNLKYELSPLLCICADASYQPQNEDKGYFNGYDRPRWLLDAKAVVNPWKKLKVSLEYQYRGVRNLYYQREPLLGTRGEEYTIRSLRLPDATLLNLGVSYTMLADRLTVWGQACNLLGSDSYIDPALPSEGFNFMLGIGVNF